MSLVVVVQCPSCDGGKKRERFCRRCQGTGEVVLTLKEEADA